jgi:hypothetical protein
MVRLEPSVAADVVNRTSGATYEWRISDETLRLIVPAVLEELTREGAVSREALQTLEAWAEIGGDMQEIFQLLVYGREGVTS